MSSDLARRPDAHRRRPHGRSEQRLLPVLSLSYARSRAALSIGEAIQRERELYGATIADLARHIEVSPYTVMAWERGRMPPTVANLMRVAWALGIPLSRLVEECGQ